MQAKDKEEKEKKEKEEKDAKDKKQKENGEIASKSYTKVLLSVTRRSSNDNR